MKAISVPLAAGLPRLLTVPQACEHLSLRKSKVYDLISSGRLKSIKLDGARRITAEALAEFISGLNGGDYDR